MLICKIYDFEYVTYTHIVEWGELGQFRYIIHQQKETT